MNGYCESNNEYLGSTEVAEFLYCNSDNYILKRRSAIEVRILLKENIVLIRTLDQLIGKVPKFKFFSLFCVLYYKTFEKYYKVRVSYKVDVIVGKYSNQLSATDANFCKWYVLSTHIDK